MDNGEAIGRFEWDPDFVAMGINPAPLQMPLQKGRIHQFRELPRNRERRVVERTVEAFRGWGRVAEELEIPAGIRSHVARTLRLEW